MDNRLTGRILSDGADEWSNWSLSLRQAALKLAAIEHGLELSPQAVHWPLLELPRAVVTRVCGHSLALKCISQADRDAGRLTPETQRVAERVHKLFDVLSDTEFDALCEKTSVKASEVRCRSTIDERKARALSQAAFISLFELDHTLTTEVAAEALAAQTMQVMTSRRVATRT